MRKKNTFSALLTLFLLVPASITWAQNISSQKGLTTAVFTTSGGNIKVYLPDDIRPGDLISGRVIAEAIGKNAKQNANNLTELKKYSISICNEKIAVDNTNKSFQFLVNADRPMTSQIALFNASGIKAGELSIPLVPEKNQQPAPSSCKIPSHGLTGAPFRLTGPFDGNSSNTNCTLDNKPMEVLAKSPRECIVLYPADATGIKTLNIQESGKQICSQQVSGVQMSVSAGKLDLMKGDKTFIEVSISGLQNLPDTALLILTNITTGVVVMQPSNIIVIPLSPDSVGSGSFNKRFDIQSLRTGSFSVNVNLDLPENTGTEAQPIQPTQPQCPGCICACFVTIELVNTIDGITTYRAKVMASCSGFHGKLPCTACGIVDAYTYEWSINSEDEKVEITAGENGVFVKTKNPNNSPFVLSITVTVTCSDNNQCTCTDEIEGGPPVPEPDKGSCACNGSCSIIQIGAGPGYLKFEAVVKAECKGSSGKGSSKVSCDVKRIDYLWHIAKNDVIGIDGNAKKNKVKIKIKKPGPYSLNLTITIYCSDGSKCTRNCNMDGTIPPDWPGTATCQMEWEELEGHAIIGRVKPQFVGTYKIRRDDFIPLGAEGSDSDLLRWTCLPDPKCAPGESKTITLNGRVRFEWSILKGEGSFVKLGCLPDNVWKDDGDYTIFKPPYLPLPVIGMDTSITISIVLKIIDDIPSQVQDFTLKKDITITIKRSRVGKNDKELRREDYYYIKVESDTKIKPDPIPAVPSGAPSCKPGGPDWKKPTPIDASAILGPDDIPGHEYILLGQWLQLRAKDSRDKDMALKVVCITSPPCIPPIPFEKEYEDNVVYVWSFTKPGLGKFGNGLPTDTGAAIIYEAPDVWPKDIAGDFFDVKIKMRPVNPTIDARKDNDGEESIYTLRIYKPGIKLSTVPLAWLPEDKNKVELISTLMRKDFNWIPAPPHACRIHFFELFDVSNEKGVCMNAPLENALLCRDLKISKEEGQEVYDDGDKLQDCNNKEYFLRARSELPVQSYKINIYSEDFGAYGFLRSFATIINGSQDETFNNDLVYFSIPLIEADARHPSKTPGRGKFGVDDNRVSIPLDVDNNHIADNGWDTPRRVHVSDPVFEYHDDDIQPPGDGTNGDGLTSYEEYRGFMIKKEVSTISGSSAVPAAPGSEHIRTDTERKTLFIHRVQKELDVSLFEEISELEVYLVDETQYNSDVLQGATSKDYRKRWINFNQTNIKNYVEQWGLKLVDYGIHEEEKKKEINGLAVNYTRKDVERPSPPNWEYEIRIYTKAIQNSCTKYGLKYIPKLRQVVAHELLHGCNVCHHGEKNPDDFSEEAYDHPRPGGLRSGDISCVMRYDNVGAISFPGFKPEIPGTKLCKDYQGTGFNKPDTLFDAKKRIKKITQIGMGDAGLGRGNCYHQIRISARGGQPEPCRQHELRKSIGDIIIPKK